MELCSFLFCSSSACWLEELCDCCLKSTTQQSISTWAMVCNSAVKLLGRFLSWRSSPRTAFQIRHTTPHSGTESQRSTRPLHPRLSVSLVCMPSSSGPLHPEQHPPSVGWLWAAGPHQHQPPATPPCCSHPIKVPWREVSFPITLPAPKPA